MKKEKNRGGENRVQDIAAGETRAAWEAPPPGDRRLGQKTREEMRNERESPGPSSSCSLLPLPRPRPRASSRGSIVIFIDWIPRERAEAPRRPPPAAPYFLPPPGRRGLPPPADRRFFLVLFYLCRARFSPGRLRFSRPRPLPRGPSGGPAAAAFARRARRVLSK